VGCINDAIVYSELNSVT